MSTHSDSMANNNERENTWFAFCNGERYKKSKQQWAYIHRKGLILKWESFNKKEGKRDKFVK